MDKILEAITVSSLAHKHQKRKGNRTPYIAHPLAVGLILSQLGQREEVIIAGILHDTLEDTEMTKEELTSRFGNEVVRLVESVTEDKSLESWEKRKAHYLESKAAAGAETKLISLADKYHNLSSIKEDLQIQGEDVWNIFTRGKKSQENFYKTFSEKIKENFDYSQYDLMSKFDQLITELF